MKYLTKEWIGNYERMIFAESVKSKRQYGRTYRIGIQKNV